MTQYLVTWQMVYEADNHIEAVAQAYGSICELAENPSVGANFVTVAYDGDHSIKTTMEFDEALALLGTIAELEGTA